MSEHWYNQKGCPQHFRADGRPTTLRDARKEILVPSSTTIIGILAKPQLDRWIKDQAVKCAFENQPITGEDADGYAKRISNISYQENSGAATYGTAFHKAAEDYFGGKGLDPEFKEQIEPIIEWKESKGISFDKLEHTFACQEDGFGGTIDICASNEKGARMILDYKTRKSNPDYPMRPYGQEILQLASYCRGYYGEQAVLDHKIHAVNIFVSSTEPGRTEIHGYKPEEVCEGWKLFKAIAEVWFKIKKYDPRSK